MPRATVSRPPDRMSAPSDLLVQLLERTGSHEAPDVEFKRARGGLPRDLWPTASAFANTSGGWILLGVSQDDAGEAVFEGVPPERLDEFAAQQRNRERLSGEVCTDEDMRVEQIGGKTIVMLRIRAVPRRRRPVFVGTNPYAGTYVRRSTGDYRCTREEVDRMIRDAAEERPDAAIRHGFRLDDLDLDAVRRYRQRFLTRTPASPWNGYDDQRFLKAIGAYRQERETGQEGWTVGGLLLFGQEEALREIRPRHLIDFRRLVDTEAGRWDDRRWDDRITWEGHLFGAFEALYPRLIAYLPTPFRLDGASRAGEGPAQVAMREALVNLLVHADYAEPEASVVFQDAQGTFFRNPGSSRVPDLDLDVRDRSDPRNPILVRAFRHIGWADEAGTGIPKILDAWDALGYRRPEIDAGTERYEFAIDLRFAHLLSDDDRAWMAALGEREDTDRHLALVAARTAGRVDNASLRRLTGLHPADATRVLTSLSGAGLLKPHGERGQRSYTLSDEAHACFRADMGNSGSSIPKTSTDIPTKETDIPSKEENIPSTPLLMPTTFPESETVWRALEERAAPVRTKARTPRRIGDDKVLELCSVTPLSAPEIGILLGWGLKRARQVTGALVQTGRLSYTLPGQIRSPNQRYRTVSQEPSLFDEPW